jgi:hypothetical protein
MGSAVKEDAVPDEIAAWLGVVMSHHSMSRGPYMGSAGESVSPDDSEPGPVARKRARSIAYWLGVVMMSRALVGSPDDTD